MGQQIDRGGSQPQAKDLTRMLQQILVAQRQADRAKTSNSASEIVTKRAPDSKKYN